MIKQLTSQQVIDELKQISQYDYTIREGEYLYTIVLDFNNKTDITESLLIMKFLSYLTECGREAGNMIERHIINCNEPMSKMKYLKLEDIKYYIENKKLFNYM